MQKLLASTVLAVGLSIAAPAMAQSSQKFESTLSESVASPIKVEVVLGEELSHRANNLPTKLKDRGSSPGRLNSGFSNNGFYGEKDLNRLAERLQDKMESRLAKEGIAVRDDASVVLKIVLTDAKPNRPTFKQLSKEVGLSHQSYGLGGASIEGQIVNASGDVIGDMSYAWYESDIRDAAYSTTWSDAHRAISRFAREAADVLAEAPAT